MAKTKDSVGSAEKLFELSKQFICDLTDIATIEDGTNVSYGLIVAGVETATALALGYYADTLEELVDLTKESQKRILSLGAGFMDKE